MTEGFLHIQYRHGILDEAQCIGHVSCKATDLIRDLAERIHANLGVPPGQQLLSYRGMKLETELRDAGGERVRDRTLDEFPRPDGAAIVLTDFHNLLLKTSKWSEEVFWVPQTESRAITLDQLRKTHAWVLDQCSGLGDGRHECFAWYGKNGNLLIYEEMSLYDLAEWVIGPSTYHDRCSFVELIASSVQEPQWFASHWWGEPIFRFLQCLMEHCEVRGLNKITTSYWVCAFANNQHKLGAEIVTDPTQTSFFRAMQKSSGVLCVLDDAGIVFTRIWCSFEASTAVLQPWLLFDIVVAREWEEVVTLNGCRRSFDRKRHDALVITEGLTQEERRSELTAPNSGASAKVKRESHFPLDLGCAGLGIDVKRSRASREVDRKRILNSIAGREGDLDAQPLMTHAMYDRVNTRLRTVFALASWPKAVVEKPDVLTDFSRIVAADTDREDMRLNFPNCKVFTDERLGEVADAIHSKMKVVQLNIMLCPKVTDAGVARLAAALPDGLRTLDLAMGFCQNAGNEGVAALAQRLPAGLQSLRLVVAGCSLVGEDGLEALAQHLPQDLRALELYFSRCHVNDASVRQLALALPPSLRSLALSFDGCRDLHHVPDLLARLSHLTSLNSLAVKLQHTKVSEAVIRDFQSWAPSDEARRVRLQERKQVCETLGSDKAARELERVAAEAAERLEGGDGVAASVHMRDAVIAVFQTWDRSGDGLVSHDEFMAIMQTLDPDFTKEHCAKLFAHADLNKDGDIDMDEFISWLFE